MNDGQEYLEWEEMDKTPNMVVQVPEKISRILEERKKVEESDNALTNELFDNEPKKQGIKEKSMFVINKMKSSGIKVVDEVIKKTIRITNEDKTNRDTKLANKNKFFNKNEKRKIHDEYTLNNLEEKSMDIEDKYLLP
jgi:hypothetical protein